MNNGRCENVILCKFYMCHSGQYVPNFIRIGRVCGKYDKTFWYVFFGSQCMYMYMLKWVLRSQLGRSDSTRRWWGNRVSTDTRMVGMSIILRLCESTATPSNAFSQFLHRVYHSIVQRRVHTVCKTWFYDLLFFLFSQTKHELLNLTVVIFLVRML